MRWLDDDRWSARSASPLLQLGLATFGILALELALIRWASGQVRLFAYFNNLILIGAFLGMGLGVALGRRRPGLLHAALPVLSVLAAVLAFSPRLGLVHLRFPDDAVMLWGAGIEDATTAQLVGHLALFLGLWLLLVAVFVCAGAAVGHLFGRRQALAAYSADLAGSLLGVVAFTLATWWQAGPTVWLALGVAPFAWLSRRVLPVAAGAVVVLLAAFSAREALFSPYNRVEVTEEGSGYRVTVNRDFHQYMHDLSDERLAALPARSPEAFAAARFRRTYDLPFVLGDGRGSALVVGAGTGNDVQAALRHGFGRVVSVDIDPVILEVGGRLHPERPYADPRAVRVVDDARAYFEHARGESFDVVCYGLLDSHAMFSSLSSLRLDNYVYTTEGIRQAWRLVAPTGHLSVSFSAFPGRWLADRLYWTIAEATGRPPIMVQQGTHYGYTYLVPGRQARLDLDRLGGLPVVTPDADRAAVRTTSDDWPFLYLRPGVFPFGYVAVLLAVCAVALVGTPLAFGRSVLRGGFDPPLFFMGAAFLLIETRGVTTVSLLFGSTWMVNAAIFGGVLVMALAANVLVERYRPRRFLPWSVGLLAAVALLWLVDYSLLQPLPLALRGTLGGLVNALPVFFAGVLVSMLLARSADPSAALGSNLLGAVLGGCLEYLSMALGLSALALLAFALYAAALLQLARRRRRDLDLLPGPAAARATPAPLGPG